jgi:hypothetical protein
MNNRSPFPRVPALRMKLSMHKGRNKRFVTIRTCAVNSQLKLSICSVLPGLLADAQKIVAEEESRLLEFFRVEFSTLVFIQAIELL